MTDQELKDLVASLAIKSDRLDKQMKQTDEKFDKMNIETNEQMKASDERLTKKLDKIGRMLGAIGNNQGDVAEEYFVNSLKDGLQIANMKFDMLVPNFTIKSKNIVDEYDILLINTDVLAIIEVKYKLHINDVQKIQKKIENLKTFKQYKNYKIYAGVAGFKVPQDVIDEAKSKGYFVLQRKGGVIKTIADDLVAA